MTHSYATLAVSRAAFEEIAKKLKAAGYTDQFEYNRHDDNTDLPVLIDMHGIALELEGA